MMFVLIAPAILIFQQASIAVPKELVKMPAGKTEVAIVDGKSITADQVNQFLWDWAADRALNEIIFVAAVESEAKKKGISVTDSEIAAYAETRYAEVKRDLPLGKTLEDELRSYGFPISHIIFRSRGELLLQKIVESEFKPTEQRKVRRILIVPKSQDESGKADAKLRADEALNRIKKGEAFDIIVKAVSNDSANVKQSGGLIGWVQPSELPKEAATALATLKAGDNTPVLESNGTYLILKVEALGPPSEAELLQARQVFLQRNMENAWQRIEKDAKVQLKLNPNAKPKG